MKYGVTLASAAFLAAAPMALAQDLTEIDKPASELEQILADEVEFDTGTQEVRVVQVTVDPNTAAAWHTHPTPVYVYVTEGELIMEVEGQETKTMRAGDASAEPLNKRMRVLNETDEPTHVVVFQISPSEEEFLEEES
jgi:quercetin dioxygenase-like cupin family protein